MKLKAIILMILILSALLIISNKNLHITEKEDSKEFLNSYTAWANQSFTNSQKIIGNTIKMNWVPE